MEVSFKVYIYTKNLTLGSEKNITFQERKTGEVFVQTFRQMERRKLSQNKLSLSEVQTIQLPPGLSWYQVSNQRKNGSWNFSTNTKDTRKYEGRCKALSQDNSLNLMTVGRDDTDGEMVAGDRDFLKSFSYIFPNYESMEDSIKLLPSSCDHLPAPPALHPPTLK